MEPADGTALHVVHPEALRPPPGLSADAHVVARLGGDDAGARGRWAGRVVALYRAGDGASVRLAAALGDWLWLGPRELLPEDQPDLCWAGALDQLGRQHAGGEVIVVAPGPRVRAALEHLVRSGRAVRRVPRGEGLGELGLPDGRDTRGLAELVGATVVEPERSHHETCARPHARPAAVPRRADPARGGR